MKIEFEYYTNKNYESYGFPYYEPSGFISINLDTIIYKSISRGDKSSTLFPLNNMKKIFKILHTMTPKEVHEKYEHDIVYYLDSEYTRMKSKKHLSKNDEKVIKRIESIKNSFVKVCT
ncbi:MAG TPA: hypothetical protein VFC79_01295 [Tissierellaceae bacterium]|nr:hypothetical protein [Tissierellaceae bacterium]